MGNKDRRFSNARICLLGCNRISLKCIIDIYITAPQTHVLSDEDAGEEMMVNQDNLSRDKNKNKK